MQAPSTPTAYDAQLERKKVLEEKAADIREHDLVKAELVMWQGVLAAIREEVLATGVLPTLTLLQDAAMAAEMGPRRKKAQEALDETERRIAANKRIMADGDAKIEAQRKEIEHNQTTITVLRDTRVIHEDATRVARETHAATANELQSKMMEDAAKVLEQETRLEALKKKEADLTRHRAAEEVRLANKGRDLAIYETRIRQAGAKLSPPMQINL